MLYTYCNIGRNVGTNCLLADKPKSAYRVSIQGFGVFFLRFLVLPYRLTGFSSAKPMVYNGNQIMMLLMIYIDYLLLITGNRHNRS